MKYISLLISLFFFNEILNAKMFKSIRNTSCGPQQIKFDEISNEQLPLYYFINYDELHDFIIYHEGYQYPSFEKTVYHELNVQKGFVASSDLEFDGETFFFELIQEDINGNHIQQINLDLNLTDYTYIAREVIGENITFEHEGVCW